MAAGKIVFALTLALAIAYTSGGAIVPRPPKVDCEYSGRLVEVRTSGCGVAPFECDIVIVFVPSVSHDILSLRISTIVGEDETPIIDQPVRDSEVVGGIQYEFALTISPPLDKLTKLELHEGGVTEICTIVDNSSN